MCLLLTGSRICTPAKSTPVQNPSLMASPTPATCAPSYTGDLPMSSSTPTSPFTLIPKCHTPTRQKAEASTSSPKQMSASKVSIKAWVTRTPRSDMVDMKTPSPRKAFTPVEQYPTASSSRVSPVFEKKAKRRLDTSSDKAEHECFSDCNCVTELEPGQKKAKHDPGSMEDDVNADSCLSLADLSKEHEKSSASQLPTEALGTQSPIGTSCHLRHNKENSTPEKNWLSAFGHKLKSDKSINQNLTSRPSPRSGSAKKAPPRTITSSPIPVSILALFLFEVFKMLPLVHYIKASSKRYSLILDRAEKGWSLHQFSHTCLCWGSLSAGLVEMVPSRDTCQKALTEVST